MMVMDCRVKGLLTNYYCSRRKRRNEGTSHPLPNEKKWRRLRAR